MRFVDEDKVDFFDYEEIDSRRKHVGFYESGGSANGRPVYLGPRGGFFYISSSGRSQYVKQDQVRFLEDDQTKLCNLSINKTLKILNKLY